MADVNCTNATAKNVFAEDKMSFIGLAPDRVISRASFCKNMCVMLGSVSHYFSQKKNKSGLKFTFISLLIFTRFFKSKENSKQLDLVHNVSTKKYYCSPINKTASKKNSA